MQPNISTNPGIYLHIPFCEQKCGYCDFYSITDLGSMDAFVSALVKEIESTADTIPGEIIFDTIYFGGGTPSLLELRHLEAILAALRRSFSFAADTEITLEANPGTVLESRLQAYRTLGINRLSLGVQSFNDRDLKFLGRIHDAQTARRAIDQARAAGFDNLNLDLIHSLPYQTLKQWQKNLETALGYQPEHLSTYNLTIEQGTPFYSMMKKGALKPKKPEVELRFLEKTAEILNAHDFYPYEISNAAHNPGYISRHNFKYWNHTDYLGFGPAAHSLWQKQRRGNVRSVQRYLDMLGEGKAPMAFSEQITAQDEEFEHIFLSLRTYAGIDLDQFKRKFHHSFLEQYRPLVSMLLSEGLMQQEGGRIRLTQKGLFISDEILPQFYNQ